MLITYIDRIHKWIAIIMIILLLALHMQVSVMAGEFQKPAITNHLAGKKKDSSLYRFLNETNLLEMENFAEEKINSNYSFRNYDMIFNVLIFLSILCGLFIFYSSHLTYWHGIFQILYQYKIKCWYRKHGKKKRMFLGM